MSEPKLGLALEGGGAKGAFHIGAVQACLEAGLRPDVVAGTSIGALNAAMIAQGDFEQAKAFWNEVSAGDVFNPDDQKLIFADLKCMDRAKATDLLSSLHTLISAGGVDNSNMKAIVQRLIDPEKLMASPVDFGVVTVDLSELRPVEIFKAEMGAENIRSYILASAAFPGFKPFRMGNNTYVDGGVYDNCPVNMLLDRGCGQVIAVRTHAVGVTRYDDKDPRVVTIRPSEDLGSILRIDAETSRHNMALGYFDALRALKKLAGRRYYLTGASLPWSQGLYTIPDGVIETACALLRVRTGHIALRRVLFERLLPVLFDELRLTRYDSYETLCLALLEDRAARANVERLRLYTPEELTAEALSARPSGRVKNRDKAVDLLLKAMVEGI